MAIVTPDQASIDLGRSRINNADVYVRPMSENGPSAFEELAKSMSKLGITLEDRAGKEKNENDRLDNERIPYYVSQFAAELDSGVVDEVQVGKRMPTASKIIVAKVTEGIGQRQYEDWARRRMEEALREDATLRTDPDKRKQFFDTMRAEMNERTKGRAFYGAGASRGLEGVINEFESGFQREGAEQFRKNEEEDLKRRVSSAIKYPKAGAAAGENGAILDFIAERAESGGNYNAYFRNGDNTSIRFTDMTVGQVLQWQQNHVAKGSISSAVGRYQIVQKTLRGLVDKLGIDPNAKFDEALQDRLGVQLLKEAGLDAYKQGGSKEVFANNLAKVWAGLPVVSGPNAGRSFYHDDGINKSKIPVGEFLAALDQKGSSSNPVSALDKEVSGINAIRRRELIVSAAIDQATSSLDISVLDRIPKELRGVSDVEQKIELARKYVMDRAEAEKDRAWKQQERTRTEQKRDAEQLVNKALLENRELSSKDLELLNRVSPDLVTGLATRKQQIADLKPQEETRKFDEVRAEMRKAIVENRDPRSVSAWRILDPKLQQQARAYADDLSKTGGALTDDYYTKRWSEDSKNLYGYLFGNPSIAVKTDPSARERQNDFEALLSTALIEHVQAGNDVPVSLLDKSKVYTRAIEMLLSVWPPQQQQAEALRNQSPPGRTSVGSGNAALPADARRMIAGSGGSTPRSDASQTVIDKGKKLYPD
jgi:hypothetical protein